MKNLDNLHFLLVLPNLFSNFLLFYGQKSFCLSFCPKLRFSDKNLAIISGKFSISGQMLNFLAKICIYIQKFDFATKFRFSGKKWIDISFCFGPNYFYLKMCP